MSGTLRQQERRIGRARELGAVVHSMKILASLNIAQYERAVQALGEYAGAIALGISVCLRPQPRFATNAPGAATRVAVVFGSDQGMVGRFNEVVAQHLAGSAAREPVARLWVVGELLAARFDERGMPATHVFALPSAVTGIGVLVGKLLAEIERARDAHPRLAVDVIRNRPVETGTHAPVSERLLPLDEAWRERHATLPWTTNKLPEPLGPPDALLASLVSEYLYIGLFRACAESLASENGYRLAAMQRAEHNIDDLVERLTQTHHSMRQAAIDEELFDVVAGFEALRVARP